MQWENDYKAVMLDGYEPKRKIGTIGVGTGLERVWNGSQVPEKSSLFQHIYNVPTKLLCKD
jgi:hypothetical protein